MMRRYFLYLSYNGANYCGWQVQPNGLSVQEVVEKSLTTLLRTPTTIVGAGRTDAGVNASLMIAHFDYAGDIDKTEIVRRLNSILPCDIAARSIAEVNADAHARFDATSRTYTYYVTTCKDPFMHHLKYRVMGDLDVEAMNHCSKTLFDYIDFTSFSKLHTDVKTNNCEIMQAHWAKHGEDYIFTIQANRFLRNMVRSIVGTLLEAGRGKLTIEGMKQIIEAQDRGAAGMSVPGHALFLDDVAYPENIFI